MGEPYGKTVPVRARHDQVVEIHWRAADGKITVVRVGHPEKDEAAKPEGKM